MNQNDLSSSPVGPANQTPQPVAAPRRPRKNKGLVVLIAALVLIAAVTAGGVFLNQTLHSFYSVDGSVLSVLTADKIGNDQLAYTARQSEDSFDYTISFPSMSREAGVSFENDIIAPQGDHTFTISYADLLAYVNEHDNLISGGGAALSFPYSADIGGKTLRHGEVTFNFPMSLGDAQVAPAVEERTMDGDRVSIITFPETLSLCGIRFDGDAAASMGGNVFAFNQDKYLLASDPVESDTVTASLPYTVQLKDSVMYTGTLSLQFSSVPYYDDSAFEQEVLREGISDIYTIRLGAEPGLSAAIDNPAFEKISDGAYQLNRLSVIGTLGAQSGTQETYQLPYKVTYTYGTKEVFTRDYTLDIDLRTPVSVNPYKAECRTGSETVSGLVPVGAAVKLGGKKLDLSDNGDGTMTFSSVIKVKEGKTYSADLVVTREGELPNTVPISIKGLSPVDYSLASSIQDSSVTLNFATDPEFTVAMKVTFYAFFESEPPDNDETQVYNSATNPIKVDKDGTASATVNFGNGYGRYTFTIKCYDANGKELYSKTKEVYYETSAMKDERLYKKSCKSIDFYDYYDYPWLWLEKDVCFGAYLSRYLNGGWFVMSDGYCEILIDCQSDEIAAFLKMHIGEWMYIYGYGDDTPEYTGYYYTSEFNLKYADPEY